jgi:uncharacterized membrane protein
MDNDTVSTGEREPDGPVDAPSRSDWFVGGLSGAIGGPVGRHAVREPAGSPWRGRFWTAGRVVLALLLVSLALHWLQKSPCNDGAWADLKQYTSFCYSDITALYGAEGGLSQGGLPYLDYALEYPVLTGAFMAAVGLPVHAASNLLPDLNQHQWFYGMTSLVLMVLAVATAAMMLSLRRRRPWDVAMFALAPALLLTATVNWDLLAIVLAVGGMYAWARHRPELAGVLLGLGTAAKLWPGFLFLPLIFLGFRAGRNAVVWRSVGIGVATWLAVNLPVMLANLDNWMEFTRLNTERAVDWGTFWYVGRDLEARWFSGAPGDQGPFQWLSAHVDPYLNWTTYVLFLLACAGIAWLVWKAPRRPRFAALAFLVVAAFLLAGKVWSQQFVLWLLPLAVLARPRWGAFLAWQAAEVAYFLTFYGQLILATPEDRRPEGLFLMPEGWFILAAAARWITVAVLCGLVIRDILHPERDPVRRSYPDDPDGGILNGAVDGAPDGQPSRWKTTLSGFSSRVTPSPSVDEVSADSHGVPATRSGSTTTVDTPSDRR